MECCTAERSVLKCMREVDCGAIATYEWPHNNGVLAVGLFDDVAAVSCDAATREENEALAINRVRELVALLDRVGVDDGRDP